MNIRPEEISKGYPKRIGRIGHAPVFEIGTKGGLFVVMSSKGGVWEPIGLGPHRAIARHIAKKKEPDMVLTELSKADHVDPQAYQRLLPEYEAATDQLAARLLDRG